MTKVTLRPSKASWIAIFLHRMDADESVSTEPLVCAGWRSHACAAAGSNAHRNHRFRLSPDRSDYRGGHAVACLVGSSCGPSLLGPHGVRVFSLGGQSIGVGIFRSAAPPNRARSLVHGYISVSAPGPDDRGSWAATASSGKRTEIPRGNPGLPPLNGLVGLPLCLCGVSFAICFVERGGI